MFQDRRVIAIIGAAGSGERLGGLLPKQFQKIGPKGERMLELSISPFQSNQAIDEILVIANQRYLQLAEEISKKFPKIRHIISGGKERQDSIGAGLKFLQARGDVTGQDLILVHDGARPYVSQELIQSVIVGASEEGAAVPTVAVKDTVREVMSDGKSRTLQRDVLRSVQTPQGFWYQWLMEGFLKAEEDGFYGTDDASLVERLGYPIELVEGAYDNIKITTKEDLPSLKQEVTDETEDRGAAMRECKMRIGSGYDVHRFADGRRLVLNGVEIPYEKGLHGHSDADVSLHALMDAMLGAAALGDIGKHFPDSSKEYEGIDSRLLLKRVVELILQEGYRIGNVDITVIAQKPKLFPYIQQMRVCISEILGIGIEDVNVKATTTEGLGFTGREEGIAAEAVCILYK